MMGTVMRYPMLLAASLLACSSRLDAPADGGHQGTGAGCDAAPSTWIFCDDFESDRSSRYFELATDNGALQRVAGVGRNGGFGMRAHWDAGTVSAGSLKLAFGRTPTSYMRPVDAGTADYREIYWRLYVRNQPGWTGGGGDKLTRAIVFAKDTWAEAAIGHVWSGGSADSRDHLVADPASGTDEAGTVRTTQYNDFANLRWLGAAQSTLSIFDAQHVGNWYCVEAHMRLNDAGQSNGVLEVWIDGKLEAQRTGLNWLGSYHAYGINAVFIENFWNAGSPQSQERYIDDFAVATTRVGC